MLHLLLSSVLAADLRVDSAGSFLIVSIDGRLVGATPLELTDVPGGAHELGFWQSATDPEPVFVEQLELSDDGALRLVVDMQLRSVEVQQLGEAEPAAEAPPPPPPDARPEPVREPAPPKEPRQGSGKGGRIALNSGVTLAGVGLAGFAGYEYLLAKQSYENFLTVQSDNAARAIYEDEVKPTRNIAIGAGVGAALALGTAAGLWASSDLVLAPTPTGLQVQGSF